jgi:DNA-binding response OmpR family regulator
MNATVLLVDDDHTISKLYQGRFLKGGFQVNMVSDGQQCLDSLDQAVPDVVVLDLNMPMVDGFEVLRRMRAESRWADIPVVVCSTRGETADIEQALKLGATDFLVKHRTRPEDVVFKVQQVLARPTEKRVMARYRLPVDAASDDVARLQCDFGLPYRLQCEACRQTLVLEVTRDFSHQEPWFTGRFVCPRCTPEPAQKGQPHGHGPAH